MADNKAPLGRRLVAAGILALAAVLASGGAAAFLGAFAGWVWRCAHFGFALVQ